MIAHAKQAHFMYTMHSPRYEPYHEFEVLIEQAVEALDDNKKSRKDAAEILTRATDLNTGILVLWVRAVIHMVLNRQYQRARAILLEYLSIVNPRLISAAEAKAAEAEGNNHPLVKELREATAAFAKREGLVPPLAESVEKDGSGGCAGCDGA